MKATLWFSVLLVLSRGWSVAGENSPAQFHPPRVDEPKIPRRSLSITNFGAVPDGRTVNTEAFARTMAALAERGGGHVVVPPGLWLTGPIRLLSKIDLHLEAGALIQFTTNHAHYPPWNFTLKNEKFTALTSPIYGENLQDVAITGAGVVDGAGQAWRPVKHSKMTDRQWRDLVASGGVVQRGGDDEIWYPTSEPREVRRPNLLKLVNCRRLLLEGVTFQNSPNWNLNPVLCEDVTLRDVTVRNPWYSQNGDGLDLEYCRDVIVRDSRFDVGDDAICLKSGSNERGRRMAAPTENVLVENCTVYHGHGGFTIGSEMSGGIRNVRVNNCLFVGTDVGLRFKSLRGRGGVVENIFISNIRMTDIATDAIGFNLYYGGQSPAEEGGGPAVNSNAPANEGTPQFRDIYIQDVICRGAKQAVALQGLPEMPIRGIHLKNVSLQADNGISCVDAVNITFDRVEMRNRFGPVLKVLSSRDVRINGLSFAADAAPVIEAQGTNNFSIVIRNTELKSAERDFELTSGATRGVIKVE
jgi:polygalacturonase